MVAPSIKTVDITLPDGTKKNIPAPMGRVRNPLPRAVSEAFQSEDILGIV